MDKIEVKLVRKGAKLPVRSTVGSAGYDLFACTEEPITLFSGERTLISTGIAIALPDNRVAAFIYARSSLGVRHGIIPSNCVGVIDSDYRGEIMVGLHNTSKETYTIEPLERIAQMIIQPVFTPNLVVVEELEDTQRGDGGFGSTGRK